MFQFLKKNKMGAIHGSIFFIVTSILWGLTNVLLHPTPYSHPVLLITINKSAEIFMSPGVIFYQMFESMIGKSDTWFIVSLILINVVFWTFIGATIEYIIKKQKQQHGG